ncbi:MAG: Glu-tRNA(Gln) amidotransferase subunit GatD, partial [Candidatus Woesearchaeota archaeon]|nr:Glu-tRNA(Gln) amidotransferase subunit GatD [Candidatus Woesearchaeota archaeon]
SKVDYETGAVFAQFSPEELVNMFPELKQLATIRSRLIRQMWSEDIRFAHYNILCKEIIQEVKNGAHAVLITHGTDTMHLTAAALAFMLQHCPIPVILVGAQRSSDRASSDAAWNLLSAVTFVTNTNFAEVGICMHENLHDENCVILPATKTRKMHSSRRDAFKPINTTAWARVNPKTRDIHFFKTDYHARKTTDHLPFRPFKEDLKVGILKMHTNMYASQYLLYKGWDGLVLEGSGMAGNIPINEIDEYTKEHTVIFNTVKELIKTGTVVLTTTQTLYGALNMNVYTTGRKMQDAGILGNFCDMIPEVAFIKLAWLLSNYPKEEVKELLCMNLVGEISSRIEVKNH